MKIKFICIYYEHVQVLMVQNDWMQNPQTWLKRYMWKLMFNIGKFLSVEILCCLMVSVTLWNASIISYFHGLSSLTKHSRRSLEFSCGYRSQGETWRYWWRLFWRHTSPCGSNCAALTHIWVRVTWLVLPLLHRWWRALFLGWSQSLRPHGWRTWARSKLYKMNTLLQEVAKAGFMAR